jgi:hypothetical protein
LWFVFAFSVSGACVVSFCRQTLAKLSFFRHAGMIGGLKICILIPEGNLAAIPFL